MTTFPPPVIVDMFYGCAAVSKWGFKESTEVVWSSVRSLYYDNVGSGSGNSPGRDYSRGGGNIKSKYPDPPEEKETSRSIRAKKRPDRDHGISSLRAARKRMEEAMDLVMLLWAQSRPAQNEKETLTQVSSVQDKVTLWLQTQ
ncbi:hypothetical protein BS47DRAFT_31129 [Hydnum rufescens UP504]|uniref:Uncharacterized protein n=1 Tax=Hydnum rufescens UP504 TaxID=1448309 RepID=A0A9P6E1J7_9AGAM|nr:hypothetical protein BS47DRAFT_31129 [Hydnum rufescens UP504]